LRRLRAAQQQEFEATAVPDGITHRFDDGPSAGNVRKTKHRRVVTLEMSQFEAVQVVRTNAPADVDGGSSLTKLVPKGATYGYDLIAQVGWETFFRGRTLEEVARDLPQRIPFSSLYDLQRKFLFYFGHLHRLATPQLNDYFQQRGGTTWLIDATIEPGTPMFLGVYDADSQWLLECWKIATEHADAITPCLEQATQRWGRPSRALHDLGDAISTACDRAWPGTVPHGICHFHLARDIGQDLYAVPHAALSQAVQRLQLHPRLKEQRKGQTEWLREHLENPTALAEALRAGRDEVSRETLGREVLVAMHQWILDYAGDGHRQGFPFDPYLLYFHRRVVRASTALDQLLTDSAVRQAAPRALLNFSRLLRDYLADDKVVSAAAQYEAAHVVFTELRVTLRLMAAGDPPLRDRFLLPEVDLRQVHQSLAVFRDKVRVQAASAADPLGRRHATIVLVHLDRYGERLSVTTDGVNRDRTTNGLEGRWGDGKHHCRRRHGRSKLTRDFQSLPAEYMLIWNLEYPQYVEMVLGDLGQLAAKLALAGESAGPWTHWRATHHPLNIGRLPRRLVRHSNFVDQLLTFYGDHCQPDVS
jgi:hypothetical protein